MKVKQDRQYARTPAELDRRYNIGGIRKDFEKKLKEYVKKSELDEYIQKYLEARKTESEE